MIYIDTIKIDGKTANTINFCLTHAPEENKEIYSQLPISYTADFVNGCRMNIIIGDDYEKKQNKVHVVTTLFDNNENTLNQQRWYNMTTLNLLSVETERKTDDGTCITDTYIVKIIKEETEKTETPADLKAAVNAVSILIHLEKSIYKFEHIGLSLDDSENTIGCDIYSAETNAINIITNYLGKNDDITYDNIKEFVDIMAHTTSIDTVFIRQYLESEKGVKNK